MKHEFISENYFYHDKIMTIMKLFRETILLLLKLHSFLINFNQKICLK